MPLIESAQIHTDPSGIAVANCQARTNDIHVFFFAQVYVSTSHYRCTHTISFASPFEKYLPFAICKRGCWLLVRAHLFALNDMVCWCVCARLTIFVVFSLFSSHESHFGIHNFIYIFLMHVLLLSFIVDLSIAIHSAPCASGSIVIRLILISQNEIHTHVNSDYIPTTVAAAKRIPFYVSIKFHFKCRIQ